MLKKLKDLTQVYRNENIEITHKKSKVIELDERDRKQTYHESGFRDSTRNFGDKIALSISFKAIYAKFQNEEKENHSKQLKYNEPYLLEKSQIETQIKTKSIVLDNILEKIEIRRTKIEGLKQEITNIPINPENYNIDAKKGASGKFWIGVLLLIPITLYLITFYISTSYSAFFKDFKPGESVMQSILDANAFTKSWSDGPLEGMFVTFIPFVFMGLGFLIHMFGETKSLLNYFKILALFILTFIFDAILAYQIESKLFDISRNINSEEFTLAIAFLEVGFWGIIFAGFLVYVIWGLVFDFIMKEHAEKDKITVALNHRKARIKIENFEIEKLFSKNHLIKEDLENLKGKIHELKRLINGVIIPVKEYQLYASEYMQGWVTSINQQLHGSALKKQELIHDCNETYEIHIEEVGSNKEIQNKIFLSQS